MAPLTGACAGASPPVAGDAPAPADVVVAGLGLSVPPPHAAMKRAAATAIGARGSRRVRDVRVWTSGCMGHATFREHGVWRVVVDRRGRRDAARGGRATRSAGRRG